jgi:hypothetical protein
MVIHLIDGSNADAVAMASKGHLNPDDLLEGLA